MPAMRGKSLVSSAFHFLRARQRKGQRDSHAILPRGNVWESRLLRAELSFCLAFKDILNRFRQHPWQVGLLEELGLRGARVVRITT